ncbi:hypothetical protein M3Y96_00393400 [Aphelenchoides besseyi]|nr:hypothetical protein M3Y96_00393400 [Aphelenchoides besseyi]
MSIKLVYIFVFLLLASPLQAVYFLSSEQQMKLLLRNLQHSKAALSRYSDSDIEDILSGYQDSAVEPNFNLQGRLLPYSLVTWFSDDSPRFDRQQRRFMRGPGFVIYN